MTKLFDPSKPVSLRCGDPARIIATDVLDYLGRSIVAIHTQEDGTEEVWLHQPNGFFGGTDRGPSLLDLVNVTGARE